MRRLTNEKSFERTCSTLTGFSLYLQV